MKLAGSSAFVMLLVLFTTQFGCAGGAVQPTADAASLQATGLSPNAVTAGHAGFVLSVRGTNFSANSSILWNGAIQPTTFVSSQMISAQIPSQSVSKASMVSVVIKNSQTGTTSNALALSIVNPIQITSTQLAAGNVGAAYSANLASAGGEAPLQWSIASGSLPSGLILNSKSGTISGVPIAAASSSFTVWVTDAMGSSAKSNLSITVGSGTQAAGSSAAIFSGKYYGPALGSDALANTTVGPNGNTVSYRFRVQHSGVLQQATVYLIPDHAGYAGGNAGTTLVNLTTDDGSAAHNPTSTVLATYTMSNVLSLPSPGRYFYIMKFSNPPTLSAGQLYHMTFTSIDSSPSVNFLSVDDLYEYSEPTPSQPTISDTDSAVLLGTNGKNWSRRKGMTPIYELDFSDGISEGIGYIEVWSGAPMPISGTNAVRETFTVSGSQANVNSVSIRLARVNGSDPLTVRLENGDGSLVEQGTVAAAALPLSSSSAPDYEWITYTFNSAYALVPGQSYHLDLEATSTSSYQIFPIRKGSSYGFKDTTYFPDGHAEVDTNGVWTGWTQWGVANQLDSDLQFYFNVVP